jgi:hypothetical protein
MFALSAATSAIDPTRSAHPSLDSQLVLPREAFATALLPDSSRRLSTWGLTTGCSSALETMLNYIDGSDFDCAEELNLVFTNSSNLSMCIQGKFWKR